MTRKALVLISSLAALTLCALFLAGTNSDEGIGILSKKSRAEKLWKTSGHADKTAEAFIHWDEDTPPEVPTSCAKCHSTPGFLDFLGADGSAKGVVDKAANVGTTVECKVCHTDENVGIVHDHTFVTFPSGIQIKDLGPEVICMECHQGRASTVSVDAAITRAAVATDDTPSRSLSFQNVHYFQAAATQFGTFAKGGYEYAEKSYDARFSHITGYNACTTCHNSHSLSVNLRACNTCHTGVKDPKTIRYFGSLKDYDGDGDKVEGIYYEILGFQEKLYDVIKKYAKNVIGVPIAYDSHSYPYFFIDTNGNGFVDPDEASSGNRYSSFSARLLRAAYNYQFSLKDPAGYAHGGKYIMQLLYDSAEDLNAQLNTPVDMESIARGDEGHFDGSSPAWRNWDSSGSVSATCTKCHTAEGLPYFLENKTNVVAPPSNGLLCTTCHTSPPAVRRAGPVTFLSGAIKDMSDASNLCLNCHQGRASKLSVDSTIAASKGPYSFVNIHYYPAGAVLFGTEVKGGYEFENKSYAGQKLFSNHNGMFDTCIECHMGTKSFNRAYDDSDDYFHNVEKPNPADCVYCHGQDPSQPYPGADPAKFKFSGIRPASTPDYDGDGNTKESIKDEIKGLEEALYARIQAYGFSIGSPVVYDSHTHPYFFKDTNGNGIADPQEVTSTNRYSFNAPHLKAAYNYQVSKKEPHGFVHNSLYIAQLLVDSIEHLGGNVSTYTWR